nr:GGDEF domain-containing phosphodiesterase [Waterburya agarophytonicola]
MICIANKKSVQEQQLLQALESSEQRYEIATKITNDGLWEWNLNSNQINYSSRWKSMLGCSNQEIKNSPVEWFARVHQADIEKLRRNLSACGQGDVSQFEMEYSLLHQDGNYRVMSCKCMAIRGTEGKIDRLVGCQTDITRHKQTEARLNYDINYDRLTRLPNRQLFIKNLQELSQIESSCLFGVLCLDLDRFKYINHNFGHQTGDCLLVKIVQKLKSCLRSGDLLARIGGDEFAILLAGFERADYPAEIASQIQQKFSAPIEVENRSILITTSIGIAPLTNINDLEHQESSYSLIEALQNAEIAMHQAKNKGKACSVVFESAAYLQSIAKFKSENELRAAIELEQFELHYQPIIKLADRQLVGFEALVRWQHPDKGMVAPGDFIPLAESTGLIIPIGWWVLRSACAQMVLWQQDRPKSKLAFISVNIAGKQFSQPYAGDIIAQILTETGLDPRCLKLEITESEIIENVNVVLSTAEKLKKLGVQLSMDDFGTGYSSLSYLHCLPVDTLKIDRSFVENIESNIHELELVKTIIKLAQVFNLDVVAEGIEREQQCDRLLELQCEYGQGYLFSKPLSLAEANNLLESVNN